MLLEKALHWGVLDNDAGRTMNDRKVFQIMRLMVATIQSVIELALFSIYYGRQRLRVSYWRAILETGDTWESNEALLPTTASDLVAYEFCHSIEESLKSSIEKGVFGYSYPSRNSADRFRTI